MQEKKNVKQKKNYKKRYNKSWKYKDTRVKYPDAKKHQIISFIKSGIRIFGYILLTVDITTAITVLVLSEVLGIFEELV